MSHDRYRRSIPAIVGVARGGGSLQGLAGQGAGGGRAGRPSAPAPRRDRALPRGPAALGDLPGTGPRRVSGRSPESWLRGAGVPALSCLRPPGPRLCAGALLGVRARLPHRVLLQGAWCLPRVHDAAPGADRGASGRAGVSAPAGAPGGVVGPQALEILPAARPRGGELGAPPLPAGGGGNPSPGERRGRSPGPSWGCLLASPVRLGAESAPALAP